MHKFHIYRTLSSTRLERSKEPEIDSELSPTVWTKLGPSHGENVFTIHSSDAFTHRGIKVPTSGTLRVQLAIGQCFKIIFC